MAINERIKFIRNLRGITQKYLGVAIGFPEKTADVRMAQYETGNRTPKEKMVADIANVLGVSPQALAVPDIDSYYGLMHTFFAIEDLYGIKINKLDDTLCLTLDKSKGTSYSAMFDMFNAWQVQAEKLRIGEITEEEYNDWRFNYPASEAKVFKAKLDKLRQQKKLTETS